GTAAVVQAVSAAVIRLDIPNAGASSAATEGLTEGWMRDKEEQTVGRITNTVDEISTAEDNPRGSIEYTSSAQTEQIDSTFTLESIREAVNDEISKLDEGEWKTICSDGMERGIAAIEEVSRPLNDEGMHLLFRLDQTNPEDVRDFNVFFKEKLIPAYKEILHLSNEECTKLRGVKVEFRGGNWMTMHDPADNKIIVYLDSIASGREVKQERLMYGYGVLHELTHGVIRALSNSPGVNMISGADYVSEGFAIKCPRLIAGMFKGDPWFNALSKLDESIVFIQKEFGLDSVDESYYAQFRLTDVGSFRDYMSVERRKSELMPSDLKPCSNVDELRTMGVAGLIANLGSQREDIR
ncbi:MAG: hypothetical protein KAU03_01395, partial [Candidatus Altiarchaeales archaeon]|nr:hypothetical protein [Candidatus Altiarchaeales archaeon]